MEILDTKITSFSKSQPPEDSENILKISQIIKLKKYDSQYYQIPTRLPLMTSEYSHYRVLFEKHTREAVGV